ncbi:DNA glycosylase [Suillus hirtellus]|nr:DNA glycosylase [Suillus hirtellus]
MSTFSQFLRSYAYTPQTSSLLKRKPLPENHDCLPVTAGKSRASKSTSHHVSHAKSKRRRSESVTTNQQRAPTGESSIYFTPSAKGVSTDDFTRKGPRKLLDEVEIVVKSASTVPPLSVHNDSLEVSKRTKKKRKLEPVDAYHRELPAMDESSLEPSEAEMKIPLTKSCYQTPMPDEARSTLQTLTFPTPSSRPRKRRKVVPSTVSLHQSTALSSKSMATSKVVTQQTDVMHRTCPDPITPVTSKYFSKVTQSGKSWVPSFLPSEDLFTHENMPAFPTYRQDLFNDLIGYIENAKPILIQAAVSDNPWQLLIAVKLLNVTTGRYAIPVFWKLMDRWPTPRDMIEADHDELVNILRPLGLYNKRAAWMKEISQEYINDPPTDVLRPSKCRLEIPARFKITAPSYVNPRKRKHYGSPQTARKTTIPYPPTPVSHYPGVGRYALDSYRIFCTSHESEEWKQVMPEDKELIRYLRWKWAYEERKIWYPDGVGVVKGVDIPYLLILVDELMEQLEPDEFWGPTDFISG